MALAWRLLGKSFLNIRMETFFFPMALFHDMAHPWRLYGAPYLEVFPLR